MCPNSGHPGSWEGDRHQQLAIAPPPGQNILPVDHPHDPGEVQMGKLLAVILPLGLLIIIIPGALADLIVLKDGTELPGRILRQDEASVVLETPAGTRSIPRDEIDRIRQRDDLWREYRERLGKIRLADAEAHFSLAEWLEGVGLFEEASARLGAVLSLDPDHAGARAKLGYQRKKGRWVVAGVDRTTGGRRGKAARRLPADVAAIAALTRSESAWERARAYERLQGILKNRRLWLLTNLRDPTGVGHEEALAEMGEALEGSALPVAIAGGSLEAIVDAHLHGSLGGPLAERLGDQRKDLARSLASVRGKARVLLPRGGPEGRGAKAREGMLAQVGQARQSALGAIYDTDSYYKTPDGVVFGQKLVDEQVQALKKVYVGFDSQVKSDLSRLLAIPVAGAGRLQRRLARSEEMLSETESFLTSQGSSPGEPVKPLAAFVRCLLAYRAGEIALANDLAGEGLSPWEGALLQRLRDLRVLEANEALAKSEPESGLAPKANELKQSKILNDYRIMLGRHALEIHPSLTECARGHSEEMTRLGYFGHESPVPERKTPSMRAKLAGYDDGVSENIHMSGGMATPEQAHDGWYHSPPHHRNMVSDAWYCIGVGQDGSHFTQNFGTRIGVRR